MKGPRKYRCEVKVENELRVLQMKAWDVPARFGQTPKPERYTMISVNNPKFELGQTLITPGAQEAMAATGESPWAFLFARHLRCDWGIVDAEDAALNDESLKDGSRLLSAYLLKDGTKIWVITEAADDNGKREATTILLPEEY